MLVPLQLCQNNLCEVIVPPPPPPPVPPRPPAPQPQTSGGGGGGGGAGIIGYDPFDKKKDDCAPRLVNGVLEYPKNCIVIVGENDQLVLRLADDAAEPEASSTPPIDFGRDLASRLLRREPELDPDDGLDAIRVWAKSSGPNKLFGQIVAQALMSHAPRQQQKPLPDAQPLPQPQPLPLYADATQEQLVPYEQWSEQWSEPTVALAAPAATEKRSYKWLWIAAGVSVAAILLVVLLSPKKSGADEKKSTKPQTTRRKRRQKR